VAYALLNKLKIIDFRFFEGRYAPLWLNGV